MGLKDSFGFGDDTAGGGGGGSVNSVTGLNTDNTDPVNPIVKIAVDGSTITGSGTVVDPLVSSGGADEKVKCTATDTTPGYLLNDKITAGAGILFGFNNPGANENMVISALGDTTLYNGNSSIGSGRKATLTDTLTWSGGSVIRDTNSVKIVEVTQESDFGIPVGGIITLLNQTIYLIHGQVTCSSSLRVSTDDIAIVGSDRNIDKLIYSGTGTFLVIQEVNFSMRNVCLSASNSVSQVLSASNYTSGNYNFGRLKTISIVDCQFRNCFNVMQIIGFDLVDILNTLFWYIEAPSVGLQFQDTSKVEITSCEFIRWFDETSITPPTGSPTPSGYATASMIELLANGVDNAGFGAVNISSSIIHPQATQNGIDIDALSTTGFGTISANAFINLGLTGSIFLPELGGLPNYSANETLKYDIFSNQGLPNSIVYGVGYVVADVANSASSTFVAVDTGGTFNTANKQRITINSDGSLTYNGTKTIYADILAIISIDDLSGSNEEFDFAIHLGGTLLPESQVGIRVDGQDVDIPTVTISTSTTIVTGDVIQLYQKSPTNDDFNLQNLMLKIKE